MYLFCCISKFLSYILICESLLFEFKDFHFYLLYVLIFPCHNKTSYASFFHSTIGGAFFLLSAFTGPVHYSGAINLFSMTTHTTAQLISAHFSFERIRAHSPSVLPVVMISSMSNTRLPRRLT